MPTFEEIYASHADLYEALVAREDYQGNILRAVEAITPLDGLEVVEFGAGTGRLTRLLAPRVRSIRAFDSSAHMLSVARALMMPLGLANWSLEVADNTRLPVPDASADLAIEGWSFGHATEWQAGRWRDAIGAMLAEMFRVLRPGGTAILMETMGTGSETPAPPNEALAVFYAWLEREHGFAATSIRTDYRFESLDEAERLTRFFFGDAMGDAVRANHWVILPECTGIWWRKK